jgi:hypothetical protein
MDAGFNITAVRQSPGALEAPAGVRGRGGRSRIVASEPRQTSHVFRCQGVRLEMAPGGVFVVGGAGLQTAVEDADEAVAELAEGGLVAGAAVAEGLVVGAGAG